MTDFIIETDLGHDPDDLFTLCHLVEAGHRIVALGLSAGSPEQVRLAAGLRDAFNMDFEIGVQKPNAKSEQLGIHDEIAKRRGWGLQTSDGPSSQVFERALQKHMNANVLIIGPATGFGEVAHLAEGRNLTFQGGFLPYSLHAPEIRDPKFEGVQSTPTFNFNGDRNAVQKILDAKIGCRHFCGKNVCHTIVLKRESLPAFSIPRTAAGEIYDEALRLYFAKHEEKKLHDPTAFVCHTHPDVPVWFTGKPTKLGSGWTTVPDYSLNCDYILCDVIRPRLWQHIFNRT